MQTFETIAIWFFWICFGGIAYAYIAYPILLTILTRLFGKQITPPPLDDANLPSISLLIAAYNEDAVIEQRIQNALALDYPREKLQIIIASDGSSDHTPEIVRRYANQGVRLLDYKSRSGKTAMLNRAIRDGEVKTDLILLSDANSHTSPDAPRLLARWFADPKVGVVCGRLVLTDPKTGNNVDSMYWKYETFLKKQESKLGALLGSNGAIYAIRTPLFQPIPDRTIIDDFVIPLQAKLDTGCDIIYDKEAVADEETPHDIGLEFRRRTRIGTGGWQAIAMLWPLLNPARGWVSFTFFSHKLLRWICPFLMFGMVAANVCLSRNSYFFHAALRIQIILYLLAGLGAMVPRSIPLARFLHLGNMFLSMNAALFYGFYKWVKMPHTGVWNRTPRPIGNGIMRRDPRLVSAKDLIIGGVMALAAMGIVYDAWFSIFSLGWIDEELSYVLLAPVVIAWLAYSRRRELDTCKVSHGWVGLLILAFGWGVFWYGYIADPVLWRSGAVVIAIGAFISAVGFNVLWRFAPAFAACIFLIPVLPSGRYHIAAPLQTATASATQTICDLIGMNVDRAGNLLSINGVDVTVAEACNGMRMVLTLFMVCYVVAFTMPMRWWVRVLFLLASPLVAIISNVARLVPTIWMFGNESKTAAESFHDISGWVMTLLSFLLLLGFAKLLQSTADSVNQPQHVPA